MAAKVVFVNFDAKVITLYKDDGVETYQFDEVEYLTEVIGTQKILYITQACEATAKQIIETVSQINEQEQNNNPYSMQDDDERYLQSARGGTLIIEEVGLTFNGSGDCKLIDEELLEAIQSSVVMKNLIRSGKLKIINRATMLRDSRRQRQHKEKTRQMIEKSRDKELDAILVNTSAERAAESMFQGRSDVEETDITDSILNDPVQKMTSEELDEALKSGGLAT